MSSANNAVKKCHNCGQYSEYNGQLYDKCKHCNALFNELEVKEHEAFEEKERQAKLRFEHPVFWVSIKPGDGFFTRMWKRFAIGFQVVYFAIVSFLVWLAAVVAG